MHKSTLLELLRTLTPDELDRFELFLKSPYFNKAANAVKFFSLMKKYAENRGLKRTKSSGRHEAWTHPVI